MGVIDIFVIMLEQYKNVSGLDNRSNWRFRDDVGKVEK